MNHHQRNCRNSMMNNKKFYKAKLYQIQKKKQLNKNKKIKILKFSNPKHKDNDLKICLLYTSDAADDMQCVDLGGRRIIKKKKKKKQGTGDGKTEQEHKKYP
eukprot:TRINITY_DN4054_c0_g2_i2.p3 TRINITY_DN4054_c0_g2~~TRINITY_DN4054_c0_g2_i2.p3  ORF type:complete len:102 (-),score=25.91 TRINITY_DN4054_c0_g2_i2:80-385(-)